MQTNTWFYFLFRVFFFKAFWTSILFKYTLLGVHNEYHKNSFENIRKDVKISMFPIPITYWSGFRIFKQNQENPEEIGMGEQSILFQYMNNYGTHSVHVVGKVTWKGNK